MKKLKTAVVVPPLRDFYFTPHRASFVGAHNLMKVLDGCGFESILFNFPISKNKPKGIPLPKKLEYLKNHLGKEMFFKEYKLFGTNFEVAAKTVLDKSPDLVFISCFAFGYAEDSIEFAKFLKKLNRQLPLAVGGAGVTVYPHYFEKSGVFDFVLTGDAEDAVPIFLERELDVKNMQKFCRNSEIVPTITIRDKQLFSVILSKGCPKNCEFCSNHLTQGKKFTLLDINYLVNQVKNISNKKIHINFEDDNILFAKEHFFDLIITLKNINKNITFSAENGLDFMLLNIDEVDFLIKNGFSQFNFSIVSKNNNILDTNQRGADFDKFENLVARISFHNVKVFTYFIAGLKGDNLENIEILISYLENLPTILGISPFYPVPGIKGYENMEIFQNKPAYLTLGSSFFPWNNCLATRELIELFCKVRKINLKKAGE